MLIDLQSQSSERPLMTLSAYSIQGRRNHMEDFFDIGYQMKPCDQRRPNEWPYEYFYFGIFDGHGGSEAAKYTKENLLKFITKQADFWSNDDEDVMRAIRNGYAQIHSSMRQELPTWPRTSKILPSTAGTTASVLFIKNGKFYTGHVGDSRIVISRENAETKQWISEQLTDDHKPESPCEIERIRRAGGDVKSKIGVHRVVWKRPIFNTETEAYLNYASSHRRQELLDMTCTYPVNESLVAGYQVIPFLAIARSLGDFWSINPYSGQYIVSPEPDVACRPIESDDKCILLATDGLWNVINSSQAGRILQELNIIKSGKRQYFEDEYFATDNFYDVAGADSENHSQSLVYYAYQIWERRRLRSDNITVVTAVLHDILSHFHKTNTKAYATRASIQSEKEYVECLRENKAEMVQIGHTHNFFERIRSGHEPRFCFPEPDDEIKAIEAILVLPPTFIGQKFDPTYPKIDCPKNYERLSLAVCRKIHRNRGIFKDTYIYIKKVSDDPADARPLPTRLNKAGKEVRDSSAQATQSIHDFGQPWNQLLYDEEEELVFIDELPEEEQELYRRALRSESSLSAMLAMADKDEDDDDEEGEELVFEHELDIHDDDRRHVDDDSHDTELVFEHEMDIDNDREYVFEHELDNQSEDNLHGEDNYDDKNDVVKAVKNKRKKADKVEKSMPQFKCLLNCSPTLRRSKRNTYKSISENAKRKNQHNSNVSASKSKRRRSQPVRCNLSRI